MKLAVVIPTLHMVEDVQGIVASVREAVPEARAVIVDNGPDASDDGWDGVDTLVVERSFLGSEGGFLRGIEAAGICDRYLLFDQDAVFEPCALGAILKVGQRFPGAIVSGNLDGNRTCWRHAEPMGDVVSAECAPWSGLLLTKTARELLLTQQRPDYFFLADDWLMTRRLRDSGVELVGVPSAVVNNGDPERWGKAAPWRRYYSVRNELLFHRDIGRFGSGHLPILRNRGRVMIGMARRGHWDHALSIARGLVDGYLNRRGFRVAPDWRKPG